MILRHTEVNLSCPKSVCQYHSRGLSNLLKGHHAGQWQPSACQSPFLELHLDHGPEQGSGGKGKVGEHPKREKWGLWSMWDPVCTWCALPGWHCWAAAHRPGRRNRTFKEGVLSVWPPRPGLVRAVVAMLCGPLHKPPPTPC